MRISWTCSVLLFGAAASALGQGATDADRDVALHAVLQAEPQGLTLEALRDETLDRDACGGTSTEARYFRVRPTRRQPGRLGDMPLVLNEPWERIVAILPDGAAVVLGGDDHWSEWSVLAAALGLAPSSAEEALRLWDCGVLLLGEEDATVDDAFEARSVLAMWNARHGPRVPQRAVDRWARENRRALRTIHEPVVVGGPDAGYVIKACFLRWGYVVRETYSVTSAGAFASGQSETLTSPFPGRHRSGHGRAGGTGRAGASHDPGRSSCVH